MTADNLSGKICHIIPENRLYKKMLTKSILVPIKLINDYHTVSINNNSLDHLPVPQHSHYINTGFTMQPHKNMPIPQHTHYINTGLTMQPHKNMLIPQQHQYISYNVSRVTKYIDNIARTLQYKDMQLPI